MGVSNVIDTLELNIIVNNKGTTARINNTTKALKNLHKVISDINGVGGVDGAVNGGGVSGSSSRGGSSRSRGSKSASSLIKNLNFGSLVAKLYFIRNITKQLGQNLAKVVQYGIDYEETLNLWQVAMKGNTAEARKFITEMNRAYGISEITLMNYQATFKNMLSSLGGINQEVAYGLSETLSQMALDYASLYNTSIESAMTKFQAVLAGQVRPIRSESGYDITQATLYEVYKSIGGTKSVRQLSETEKRLLRILAVYRQMKDTAVGDYAKTITSTANQIRYMSETIKDIATWVGVGANQWLKQSNILIRINAYLIALKELAKSFAINMGYVEESEEKANDPLADIEDGWDGINKQVDEYQGKLLGFDKFQVLSSADTGDGADISAELLKAMQEYQQILSQSQNIALFGDAEKNIKGAYDILKDWGYEYDEQSGQWLKDGKTVKDNILDIAESLSGILFVAGLLISPWLAILGAIEYCYWTNEDFKKSVNESFGKIANNWLPVIEDVGVLFWDIAEQIMPIIADILENFAESSDEIAVIFGDIVFLTGQLTPSLIPALKIIASIVELLEPALFLLSQFGRLIASGLTIATNAINLTLTPLLAIVEVITKMVRIIKELIGAIRSGNISSFIDFLDQELRNWNVADYVKGNISSSVNILDRTYSEYFGEPLFTEENAKKLFYNGKETIGFSNYPSGRGSTVMSAGQMEDAVARGFIRGLAASDSSGANNGSVEIYVDGQKLFNVLRNTAKRNGYDYVTV
ncbi:MAG: hypothetical protein J6V20_01445 [Bacteroidaceae bacterium]|nr:hypothetical protein [Bacteroidaceae bacterium]